MEKILVGVPCYNCAPQIVRVIAALSELQLPATMTVVFVDNGSTDGTLEAVLAAATHLPRYLVLKNLRNYGLGGSQRILFGHALAHGFDRVAILHGDDQAVPAELALLLGHVAERRCHVLGSRFSAGARRIGYQRSRVLGNLGLNLFFSVVLRRRIEDLGSGLNLFDVELLRQIDLRTLGRGFSFNFELLLSFIDHRQPFEFYPITWRETDQTSNARNLRVAASMLSSWARWVTGRRVVDGDSLSADILVRHLPLGERESDGVR